VAFQVVNDELGRGNVAIEHTATSIRPTKANAGDAKLIQCARFGMRRPFAGNAQGADYHLSFI
jgi:hypothetical protein